MKELYEQPDMIVLQVKVEDVITDSYSDNQLPEVNV